MCKHHQRNDSFARGVVSADGTVQLNLHHNHAPDDAAEEIMIFRRQLKTLVVTRTGILREIFNYISVL